METLRIALVQMNATVGDLAKNRDRIIRGLEDARKAGAAFVAFPELAVTGYPPEDLVLSPQFVADNVKALGDVCAATRGITAAVGYVDCGDDIYNAAAILHDGKHVATYHKRFLPNYSVFDEDRYFQAGTKGLVVELGAVRIGINICEDIWYPGGPTTDEALAGDADVILNISSSPFCAGKHAQRKKMLAVRAVDNVVCVAYLNMVGGQDELIFDGRSLVVNEAGETLAEGRAFDEDLVVVDLPIDSVFRRRLKDPRRRKEKLRTGAHSDVDIVPLAAPAFASAPALATAPAYAPASPDEEVYGALVLGVRDYVQKNKFQKVVVGLSGGIDSALTAAIAVDALGATNVVGVTMPSRFSSDATRADAEAVAHALGVRFLTLPIEPLAAAFDTALAHDFSGLPRDITEENLQARIRGNLLMALSNKFGWLVLSTGNKSELSMGYCTLYGDMAGGFAILKDVPKTLVYRLAALRNARSPVIPESTIARPPTAELRDNQKDEDSLPPYATLDPILRLYVEEDANEDEIVAAGFDRATVRRVCRTVDTSEYKRRQGPVGIKITPRAFGKDRRFPITNAYTRTV
ncbi:MAG: NAD+ synthase [Deltaproteobacteria bacterium]|nr:NAD+ synthase [Deltaproteobacteria bacterium]